MQLNREEMATLVDMLFLALWATESSIQDEAEAQPALKRFSDLAEKIFHEARRSGAVRGLDFDSAQGIHLPTREYEESSFGLRCFEALRNSAFWEELSHRLAERDVAEQGGGNGGPGDEDRRVLELEKAYWQKFVDSGVERLRLLEPYPHG